MYLSLFVTQISTLSLSLPLTLILTLTFTLLSPLTFSHI